MKITIDFENGKQGVITIDEPVSVQGAMSMINILVPEMIEKSIKAQDD